MSERWQPVRAGLCNVWRYQDEVLTFHRGRLLLRGANGSGKSMALELLLPFLLDASTRAERLTSATRSRGGLYDRLMASGASSPVGFLWVEFRAGDDVFTIGVRLRASSSTHRVDTTWFAAPVSVGRDVELLDGQRVPLSNQALREVLGDDHVFDSAEAYRRAVRTTLFPGFDERQYEAVVTTLLSLRREKISQDLSPSKLSDVLTESLPPLDEYRLAEVAEGFERLDRRQAAIDRLQRDRGELRKLGRRHRQYVRLVLAGVARRVVAAESARDQVTRQGREAAAALEECRTELRSVREERAAGEREQRQRRAEAAALRDRDAYKEGSRLESLRQEGERATRRAGEAAARAERRAGAATKATTRAETAADEERVARRNEATARAEVERAADEADAVGLFTEAVEATPDAAERIVAAWEAAREQAVADVQRTLRELERAVEERARREQAVDAERTELVEAESAQAAATSAEDAARADYAGAVHTWAAGVDELADPSTLLAALPAPPDEPADVQAAIGRLAAEAGAAIAVARASVESQLDDLDRRTAELEAERVNLAAGEVAAPTPPDWRSPRRAERAGAPFWRLVDVVDGCSAEAVDGVEAALVASGLLDAWITPEGAVVLSADEADSFVVPRLEVGGSGTLDLTGVLRPADLDEPPVPGSVVAEVLRSIALVDAAADAAAGATAIGRDGSFRLGPLAGRGAAGPASFLGAVAREQAHRRRLVEIDDGLAALARQRSELARRMDDLDRRRGLLGAEVDGQPPAAGVAAAVRAVELAAARVADGARRVGAAVEARGVAEEAAKAAQRRLMQVASEHRLPTEAEALTEYARRVRLVRDLMVPWLRRRRDVAVAEAGHGRALEAAEAAQASALEAAVAADAEKTEADELAARLRALEASVGEEYREIAERIRAAERRVDELGRADRALTERELVLARREGSLEERVSSVDARRIEAEREREQSHAVLVAAISDGLVVDAEVGVEVADDGGSGVTAVLERARTLSASLGDDPADEAALSKEHQRLSDALHQAREAGSVELVFEQSSSGWWLLRGLAGGLRRRLPEVVVALDAELHAAEQELLADEQRLFAETLSGSVRQAVADRLRRATALIEGINGELQKVRTEAAGVGVRLKWEVDPEQPDAVRSARRLLLRDAADWSESERESMFAFFRVRLEEARASLDGTSDWTSRLREALDYRRWHRFTLEIAHRDWEGLQPATQSRLARLSTGERSIALHLPMLASVAAHYDGASEGRGCPRLILLDELFAGVDVVNRAQLFGMFVTWDLDAVFTSDHEWCAYASLDGIAIHHLHAAERGEPVTTARFVWDGRSRAAAPVGLVDA